jgi:basic membrane protein A
VHRSAIRAIVIALTLAVGSFAVAACGSSDDNSTSSGSAATSAASTSTAAPAKKIKVGLVTDIGGLNDRSFNALANQGLKNAQSQLGIEGRVLISKSNADYTPNLTTLAQQKYDLVISVGFLMAEATEKVAGKFPDV